MMTDGGSILRPKKTGLRPVNQRKMAKAVRRAIGLGLHPSVHKHPELLMRSKEWSTVFAPHMREQNQKLQQQQQQGRLQAGMKVTGF